MSFLWEIFPDPKPSQQVSFQHVPTASCPIKALIILNIAVYLSAQLTCILSEADITPFFSIVFLTLRIVPVVLNEHLHHQLTSASKIYMVKLQS